MGRHIPWVDDRVEDFVRAYWNTDVREHSSSAFARASLRKQGIEEQVRRLLLDAIQRDVVTASAWRDLCNVTVHSKDDVRHDAADFWGWLFDDEPPPGAQVSRDPLGPPQS